MCHIVNARADTIESVVSGIDHGYAKFGVRFFIAGGRTIFTVAGDVHGQRTVFGGDFGLERHRLLHEFLGAAVVINSG